MRAPLWPSVERPGELGGHSVFVLLIGQLSCGRRRELLIVYLAVDAEMQSAAERESPLAETGPH